MAGTRFRDSQWIVPASILLIVQHGTALVLSYEVGFTERPPTISYMVIGLVLSLAAGLAIVLRRLWAMWRQGEAEPTRRLLTETDYAAVATYLIGFQLVALQIAALTWLKEMIPLVIPFWADPPLASLERALLGVDAWRLVPEFLVAVLDPIYATWAPVKTGALLLILCLPASELKVRALLAYFLTVGVLGVTGQYLFSSAGPIFYDRLLSSDQFGELAERIRVHAPIADLASDYLWNVYTNGEAGIGAGISAMPSVHVATTAWMALAVSSLWPKIRALTWGFWLLIFVGSFALGWHYLLDSVVGTIGAILCWKLADRYLRLTAKPSASVAVTPAL